MPVEDVPVEDVPVEDVQLDESAAPEFVIDGPKEEAKLHLDKDDVQAIEQEIDENFIPEASALLGLDSINQSSETIIENTVQSSLVEAQEEVHDIPIEEEIDEESDSEVEEEKPEIQDVEENEITEVDEESDDSPIPSRAAPSITGEMSVRPTSLPATAELDPKTGRWMINGVPVGPKVTATGLDSDSNNRRIGGEDPLKESKKKEEIPPQKNTERRGEKRGQKIESQESDAPPPKLTKDGQKEHEQLPDMPEMTGRPNAERPKERKDDVQLPDMPKF